MLSIQRTKFSSKLISSTLIFVIMYLFIALLKKCTLVHPDPYSLFRASVVNGHCNMNYVKGDLVLLPQPNYLILGGEIGTLNCKMC